MKNVIIIPGITGSTLLNINDTKIDTVYSFIEKSFENMEQLKLNLKGDGDVEDLALIEKGVLESPAYSEIKSFFRNQEYRSFLFAYDWRKSILLNSNYLEQFIEKLRSKLGDSKQKFYFITHSMGGLVFQGCLDYLIKKNVLEKAVLVAPPFQGSPEALKALVIGKNNFLNSKDRFRKVARTFPSMFELLPHYDNAIVNEQNQNVDIYNPNNWQSNLYIEEAEAEDKKLMHKRITDAKITKHTLQNLVKNLPDNMKKKIIVLSGDGENTLNKVIVKKYDPSQSVSNFFDFENGIYNKNADGTVPDASVGFYDNVFMRLKIVKDKFPNSFADLFVNQHSVFLNSGKVQDICRRFFDDLENSEFTHPSKDFINDWWNFPGGKVYKVN